MKFSLCMIVKNEASILRDCLDSLKDIMDEIIIVDAGSTDDTKKIAESYTPYVYDYEWHDDFAAARNFIFILRTLTRSLTRKTAQNSRRSSVCFFRRWRLYR